MNIKIIHIAECGGGVDKYLEMLIPRLSRYPQMEQFFICSNNYDVTKYKDYCNIIQTELTQSLAPWKIINYVGKLRREILKIDADIIYLHSSFAGGLGRLAMYRNYKAKVIYNPHGWAFNIHSIKSFLYLFVERFLSYKTDKIVCISSSEYESAIHNKICNISKLVIIENGIDIQLVKNAICIDKESNNIDSNALIIGYVGRITRQKSPDIFIKAASIVQDKIHREEYIWNDRIIKEIHLIIVGCGEEEEYIRSLAAKYKIKLTITGWTTDVYSWMKLFDIAMLLSRWEGFGLAIAEYLTAGKPVIATKVDAIPTLIDNEIDGLLVEPDDIYAIADKVIWLLTHPLEVKKMISCGQAKAEHRFSINRVSSETYNLITSLLN